MYDIECTQCKDIIQEDDDAYIYDSKIFDDTDCLIQYMYDNNMLNHIKLVSAED